LEKKVTLFSNSPLDSSEAFFALCKASGKWGLLISFHLDPDMDDSYGQLLKAAPYLDPERDFQVMADGFGIMLFDTESEMEVFYNLTVGDDGPTSSNSYNPGAEGVRVYALTCNPEGQCHNENT
jgi:hypothetical protein